MLRVITTLVTLLWSLAACSCLWAQSGAGSFGCATWGQHPALVKGCYPGKEMAVVSEAPLILMLKDKFANENAYLGFKFQDEKLFQVKVLLEINATRPHDYTKKFLELEKYLTGRHGEPAQKIRKTISNPFAEDAVVIRVGKGHYQDTWKTPDTEVLLTLVGENQKLVLSVQYGQAAPQ
jgi:hypothetical protein